MADEKVPEVIWRHYGVTLRFEGYEISLNRPQAVELMNKINFSINTMRIVDSDA